MITGKKALIGGLFKAVLFVILLLFLIGFFTSLWGNASNAASSLVNKELDQFQSEVGSLIHPDLPLAQHNFWQNQFINMIGSALQTSDMQGDFCYGTFFTAPDFKGLKGWSITFLQEGENLLIQLEDNRGTIGARTKGISSLEKKKLCIRTADGKETNAQQITIKFGEDKSYYYTTDDLQKGVKKEFYYDPYLHDLNQFKKNSFIFDWLSADSTESNLFLFTYSKSSSKFCITPMEKKGEDNSIRFKAIKPLLNPPINAVEYPKFCDLPDGVAGGATVVDKKVCFYTPCTSFGSHAMKDAGIFDELDKVQSITETYCGRFSVRCGQVCLLNGIKHRGPTITYYDCESCSKFSSCTDIDDQEPCENALNLCNMNCVWNLNDEKCLSK